MTGDYEAWLINVLRDKEEAAAYLQVALEEYQKDENTEALLSPYSEYGALSPRAPGIPSLSSQRKSSQVELKREEKGRNCGI